MTKGEKESPSVEGDLKIVRSLIDKEKLDSVLSNLNIDNVYGTLKKVPIGVVRLMTYLFLEVDVEKKLPALKAEERIPMESLLETARKYRGGEFVKAFAQRLRGDEGLRKKFGVSLGKGTDPREEKILKTISKILCVPELMLISRRVYICMSFMQNDEVLLTTNAEIDDILRLISSLLGSTSNTLKYLRENARGVKANIEFTYCKTYIEKIASLSRHLKRELSEIEKQTKKTHGGKRVGQKKVKQS